MAHGERGMVMETLSSKGKITLLDPSFPILKFATKFWLFNESSFFFHSFNY